MKRVVLIVLDSVGIGEGPDAAEFGDAGSATLPHLAAAAGGLNAPTLQALGLGNIPPLVPTLQPIRGVSPVRDPLASYGVMQELSEGKDTVTGHWEIAGLYMRPGFSLMPPGPPSFSGEVIAAFEEGTGRKMIGNKAASGTGIIDELGAEHMKSGAWIVYTSADSVFQIAAHEEIIPLKEQYRGCEIARKLCDPLRIGRVIARPFIGTPGAFERTKNRRDFTFQPSEPTILERLKNAGVPVYAVGKIEDIYAHRGITEADHTGSTEDSQKAVERFTREKPHGLIFANYIDFDMLYGHRRDAVGYARAVEQTDRWLNDYLPRLGPEDMLILTADHGNDPTFKGSDHTREYVPLLVYQRGKPGRSLGLRKGFYDVAQSIASFFGIASLPRGVSFL